MGVSDKPAALALFDRLGGIEVVGDAAEDRVLVRLRGIGPAAVNRALVEAGIEVPALVPRAGTLEELFLSVTSSEPGVA